HHQALRPRGDRRLLSRRVRTFEYRHHSGWTADARWDGVAGARAFRIAAAEAGSGRRRIAFDARADRAAEQEIARAGAVVSRGAVLSAAARGALHVLHPEYAARRRDELTALP